MATTHLSETKNFHTIYGVKTIQMTAWCHLPTIFKQRTALHLTGLITLCAALVLTLLFSHVSLAAPGTNKVITFQGRLLTAAGAVVPDGYYNIQFKIYENGSGADAGNTDGTLKWTESYLNNGGTSGVEVKSGYFSVSLGSLNPFGTSVDWTQDKIWLSMNVAGSSASCTSFGTAPCADDGEMLPMRRITATPFAINAEQLGGRDASGFIQNTTTLQPANIAIQSTDAANVAATIQGANSQTADILQVSAAGTGTPLLAVASDGAVTAQNSTDSTSAFSVKDTSGNALLSVDTANSNVSIGGIKVSAGVPSDPNANSLWGTETPSGASYNDSTTITLGTVFRTALDGSIKGAKFYNPSGGNVSGNDMAQLWSCATAACTTGQGVTLLATTGITADPTVGWQTVNFSTPIPITANTYYVITHYSADGQYFAAPGYFTKPRINGPITAPSSTESQNSRYRTGPVGFPADSFNSSNYWTDVLFVPDTKLNQIKSADSLDISTDTNMSIGAAGDMAIQGSNVAISASGSGGNVTINGGASGILNGNGGNVTISAGKGNGTGSNGLVVIDTPAFSIASSDSGCLTSGALVATSCSVSVGSVNNYAGVMVGFSASGQTATLPNPTLQTAGRIYYVTAANSSEDFNLKVNTGDGAGVEQTVTMKKNTTVSLLWNGSDWTVVSGGSTSTPTLQNAYDNSVQSTGSADIQVTGENGSGALTVRDNATTPVSSTLLGVEGANSAPLFSVNNKVTNGTEHTADGTVHDGANFTTNWLTAGSASVSRITTDGQEASDSAQVDAGTSADNGIRNKLAINPLANSHYRTSVYAKLVSGDAFSDFKVRYSPDGGTTFVDCTNYSTQTIVTTGWTQITCDLTTDATAVTDPYMYLVQPTAPTGARTFLIDTLSFTLASNATSNVKVGSGSGSSATLFTLDKSASAPTESDNDALLGSMYYDTTLGKVQCYEAEGWGACGASPDTFVTISPEYTNAVMNGTDIGTITSDLCSDTLNINDGSASQPTVCGANETYNFYKWTSAETTDQTRSIFVTYQLPSTFKQFVAGSTSLAGRTNSADSSVTYQVYRDTSSGLTSCGSVISVASGSQSTWQNVAASGSADPSMCGFTAGDSILVRINLGAKNDANAYVSNLNFTFSNN